MLSEAKHPNDRRQWLCVAYAFPPINRSGTHRTLAFVKHLSRLGWDSTVLTVRPDGEEIDDELVATIPRGSQIIRTRWIDWTNWLNPGNWLTWMRAFIHDRANPSRSSLFALRSSACNRQSTISNRQFPTGELPIANCQLPIWARLRGWFSQLLRLPDSRVGWLPFGLVAGLRAIWGRKPEVIYSTSPHMTAHLIAWALSRLTRIPWVADFRDPWTENPFRHIPIASLRRLDCWLESLVLRGASRLVCTTPTMLTSLRSRGREITRKVACIPNGVDADLWRGVIPQRLSDGQFCIVHAGQFYGRRSPHTLFAGLRAAIEAKPELANRVKLLLVGSKEFDGRPLESLAEEAGVAEQVTVLGMRSHSETRALLAGADAVVLVGASGDGADMQVPNKLFEYLGTGRPILALLDASNPAVEILDQAHADSIVCDPGDVKAAGKGIVAIAESPRPSVAGAWSGVAQFHRVRGAAALEAVFQEITRRSPLPICAPPIELLIA